MCKVINENTSEVLYKDSYNNCDCYIGKNDLRDYDNVIIQEVNIDELFDDLNK